MKARIGIDLGTTNSAAAMVYDDGPHVIPRGRPEVIPSVVSYRWRSGEDDVVAGAEAANESHRRVIRSIKRLMGRTYGAAMKESADRYFPTAWLARRFENDLVVLLPADGEDEPRRLWPHEISARILEVVRAHAEHHLEVSIEEAVITVPAYFQDPHRGATLEAAKLAGLDVLEPLLDEPTAAAFAFGRTVGVSLDEPLLVVDWGGGTFDVTLLANHGRDWMQLGIGGDLNLGGDDVDAELVRLALERQGLSEELLEHALASHALLREARRVKHRLSEGDEAAFGCIFPDPDTDDKASISTLIQRSELEDRIEPLVEKALATVEPCLKTGGLELDEVEKVLLVGGSTRLPLFWKRLRERLPRARIHDEVDPMQAVALGAAIYASQERPDVSRLCPYGYAIRNGEELIEVIPPNMEAPTPADLPFRLDRPLRTTYDGQSVYRIQLHRFTRHENLRNVSGPSYERIFARQMPPSPRDSEVGLELRLDENKVLHARIFPPGDATTRDVEASMGEIGENAVLTTLADHSLESEALLEANRDNPAAIFKRLETAWREAGEALEAGDFETCERLAQELEDTLETAKTENTPTETKERVLGWVDFYEVNLLTFFWDVIETDLREEIVRRIRALRIMSETLAPDDKLQSELSHLDSLFFSAKAGLIFRAYHTAHLVGVPPSLRNQMIALCLDASDALLAKRGERYQRLKAELRMKLEEADKRWHEWFERGDVHVASPDLRVGDAPKRKRKR